MARLYRTSVRPGRRSLEESNFHPFWAHEPRMKRIHKATNRGLRLNTSFAPQFLNLKDT